MTRLAMRGSARQHLAGRGDLLWGRNIAYGEVVAAMACGSLPVDSISEPRIDRLKATHATGPNIIDLQKH